MKFLKTFLAFTATLQAALLLIACSDSKITGTDEQANSITANLDSALAEWTANDTLVASETQSDTCMTCMSFDFLLPKPGIEVKNGTLYKNVDTDFESLACGTDSNWFVYSVNAGDSLIHKYLVLPDSMSAGDFESDCIAERGLFGTDTTSKTAGQKVHSCDLESAEHLNESRQYVDPNWKKYAELIVGICRE